MLDQPRGTQRYQPRTPSDEPRLLREMRQLARQRPRFGADRIHKLLIAREWQVNPKRVHRLWKQEQMQVPREQHRKRRLPGCSANGCIRHRAERINHVWSYDFVADRTEDGRQVKLLVVIDEYTRECLAIEVGRSFTSREVIDVLPRISHLTSHTLARDLRQALAKQVVGRSTCQCDGRTQWVTPRTMICGSVLTAA